MRENPAVRPVPEAAQTDCTDAEPPAVLRIRTGDLLMGAREVVLDHDGQDYRLRVTASGKLILTK